MHTFRVKVQRIQLNFCYEEFVQLALEKDACIAYAVNRFFCISFDNCSRYLVIALKTTSTIIEQKRNVKSSENYTRKDNLRINDYENCLRIVDPRTSARILPN